MSAGYGGTVPVSNNQGGVDTHNNHSPPLEEFDDLDDFLDNATMNTTRNNNNLNSLLNVRDRLHHVLFTKAALAYATIFPNPVRRFMEFMVLLKAISTFFVLAYAHMVFSRVPTNCLEHIRDEWPRDGILRVEILRNGGDDYSIEKSYAKEERLRQEKVDEFTSVLGLLAGDGFINIEPSTVDDDREAIDSNEAGHKSYMLSDGEIMMSGATVSGDAQDRDLNTINTTISPTLSTQLEWLHSVIDALWIGPAISEKGPRGEVITSLPNLDDKLTEQNANSSKSTTAQNLREKVSDADKAISLEDSYIVEYSLEHGYLRLSPTARQRLKIPVKIVTLDPINDKCFGDGFSRFILDKFLGYNDILMASIRTLAQHEDNKGFCRNVVTGEQYHFVNKWMAKTSYLAAFFVMLTFTLSLSMLLCYTHHQIFIFVVQFVRMFELNIAIPLPTSSLLVSLLALIGTEALTSEYFGDFKTAFYVILTVWVANQYDSICCHTPITKRYWLRFFYLYHFLFYAYHYRFNGAHSRLALATSLLLMFHSMLFFFHHYELPVVLQQAHLQQVLFMNPGVHTQTNQVRLRDVNIDIQFTLDFRRGRVLHLPALENAPDNVDPNTVDSGQTTRDPGEDGESSSARTSGDHDQTDPTPPSAGDSSSTQVSES